MMGHEYCATVEEINTIYAIFKRNAKHGSTEVGMAMLKVMSLIGCHFPNRRKRISHDSPETYISLDSVSWVGGILAMVCGYR